MDYSRFGRGYELYVETRDDETILIKPPFTMEFEVVRNILTSSNVSQIRVTNLNENHRNQIRKNAYDLLDIRKLLLRVGYGKQLPVIFSGNITVGSSSKVGGDTDWITEIESFDGGAAFGNAYTSQTFPSGTPKRNIIQSLIESLSSQGVETGSISDYDGVTARATTYDGNTVEILKQISNGDFFIDNGVAHCLADSDCIQGDIEVIDSGSGLLGPPTLEQTTIKFDMLLEPRIKIGQIIQLRSSDVPKFNGIYKVAAVKHRGVISEVVSGDSVTTVTVYIGVNGLKAVDV